MTAPLVGDPATAYWAETVIARLGLLPADSGHGTFTITFSASATATASVSFGKTFAGIPNIVLGSSPVSGNTPIDIGPVSVSTTGFTYYAKDPAGSVSTTVTGTWIAVYG